jgi:MurNAc alpha-1-phosphate uridylyltransferase
MILAAGRGERLRPHTDTLPKPLLAVRGRPLIEHHFAALHRAAITELVINTGWLAGRLHEHIGDGARFGLSVQWSDEGYPPLETGGGIQRALPLLGTAPFWVVNGDVYCDYPLAQRALAPGLLAHLILVPNPPQHPAGDFALEGGYITSATAGRHTYSGLAVLRPELFAECQPGRFPLAPLLRAAAARGAVTGELHKGSWSDVGTPERLAALAAQPN